MTSPSSRRYFNGGRIRAFIREPAGCSVDVEPGERRGRDSSGGGEATADPVLRAKYIDFCSAHLTEVFLSLSDERIYELVEEAAREAEVRAGTLGFTAMVRLVTQKLRHGIPLPDFETWRDDYVAHPDRYEPYLLGLWEELLDQRNGR